MTQEIELAWAAGFFDGEGSTSGFVYPAGRQLMLSISQVELQPLQRFMDAVGGDGSIKWQVQREHPIHVYRLYGIKAVRVLKLLWPYLSEPKRLQATKAMLNIAFVSTKKPNPRSRQEYCLRGHKFSEVGVYVDSRGRRECMACRNARRSGKLPPITPAVTLPNYLPMREYDPALGQRQWTP